MSAKVLSTIELTGIEKIFSTHGSWLYICHAAHLSGNQSIVVNNIPQVIPHLLKRHPRMRSRLQVNGYQKTLEVLDYDQCCQTFRIFQKNSGFSHFFRIFSGFRIFPDFR
jgi:hypothetical protein